MGNRVVAAALCAMLACGGAPPAPRPAPPTSTLRYYRPLEMTSDARRADRAVILGTDERDGSTVRLLPASRAVVVDATFAGQDGVRPPSGSRIAITLTVAVVGPPVAVPAGPGPAAAGSAAPGSAAPSTAPASSSSASTPVSSSAPPVASSAATPGAPSAVIAPGDASWHAAMSRAHLVAATALGKDPGDVVISAAPAVPSNGMAASALIAAGVMAALTGDALDPAATVIGALHPDGTIGPAAGLPEQVVAAIAHGKTRIGVPGGMRIARSLATGNDVDLGELARARRAEVVELATVYDAYRLMTRKPLPAPVPVGEAEMALDGETLEGLRTRYLDWQKRLAVEWAPLLQLEQSGRLPAAVERLVRAAQQRSAAHMPSRCIARARSPLRTGACGTRGWTPPARTTPTACSRSCTLVMSRAPRPRSRRSRRPRRAPAVWWPGSASSDRRRSRATSR
jgi:hypothetical protein